MKGRWSLPDVSCGQEDRQVDVGPSSRALADLLPGVSALPAALVRALDERATVREIAAGAVLLRQRVVVTDLIVLLSGRIATLVDFAGIGELVVETTEEPGRVFGWSGLHAPGRATATVRADADSRVVTLPLAPVLGGPPRWTAALCALVAGTLADRTRELQVRWSTAADAQEGHDNA
jgi:CRP-like cAMP-binding protein